MMGYRVETRLTALLVALLACNSANACPSQTGAPREFLIAALNYTGEGGKRDPRFTYFECAFKLGRELLLSNRFSEYLKSDADRAIRLAQETAKLQSDGEVEARNVDDGDALKVYHGRHEQLRKAAIERLVNFTPRPTGEVVQHISSLVSSFAKMGNAHGVVETVEAYDLAFIDPETRFVYLKAVASCPAWDMVSAERMDSVILGKRLKVSACDEAANQAQDLLCPMSAQSQRVRSLWSKFGATGRACP